MNDAQFDQLITLLESKDPSRRREAIIAMARSQEPRALRYLATVHKSDPVPELRELALKAGRHLKREIESGAWVGQEETEESAAEEEKAKREVVNVSASAEKKSKELVDAAMTYMTQDNVALAEREIRQAFRLNPNLRHDQFANSLAENIMGMSGEPLYEELSRNVTVKRKRKPKDPANEVSWTTAFVDLAIYWVVLVAASLLGLLFSNSQLNDLYSSVDWNALDPEAMASVEMMQSFANASLPFIIMYVVFYSLFSVIMTVIFFYAPLHMGATMMLGGEGTFTSLIHKVTPVQIVFTLLYSVAGLFAAHIVMSSTMELLATTLQNPELYETNPAAAEQMVMQYSQSIQGAASVGLFMMLASLVYFFVMSRQVGKTYDFGTGKGCVAIIISVILLGVFICILSFALQSFFMSFLPDPQMFTTAM